MEQLKDTEKTTLKITKVQQGWRNKTCDHAHLSTEDRRDPSQVSWGSGLQPSELGAGLGHAAENRTGRKMREVVQVCKQP